MTRKRPLPVAQTMIPIVGSSEMFPVRRIYCIGRNYAAHAREMGSDPNREPPFFFQKPSDAIQLVPPGQTIDHPYPTLTKNYHYEIELVAALGKGGRNMSQEQALDLVYGYAIGLDMTRRDLQRGMGDQKKPWEIGKSFDHSAPIGPIHPVRSTGHFKNGAIWLKVNDTVKQQADPGPDDLVCRRADKQTVRGIRADAGRHHLFRHAGKCRTVVRGDMMEGSYRRLAQHQLQGRLELAKLAATGCVCSKDTPMIAIP